MPVIVRPGDPMMAPIDEGESIEDYVDRAIGNLAFYDRGTTLKNLSKRSEAIRRLEQKCPLDRLYRVEATINGTKGHLLGIINGYREPVRGMPAQCLVILLGVRKGAGSPSAPIPVPPEGLEDVTTEALKVPHASKPGTPPSPLRLRAVRVFALQQAPVYADPSFA